MSKYLKLFETTPEYEAYINGGGSSPKRQRGEG